MRLEILPILRPLMLCIDVVRHEEAKLHGGIRFIESLAVVR